MPSSAAWPALDYYRTVWTPLRRHAGPGPMSVTDGRDPGWAELVALTTPEDLLRDRGTDRLGVSSHWPGRLVLRVRPGDGADAATAATATLDLAEQLVADGLVPVPLVDGVGGLALLATATGDILAAARRYASGLATRAPELATLDPGQADGRCVVLTGWTVTSEHPDLVPVPYSLVRGSDGPAPVAPLHLDEVAAVAAGMPLEIEVGDVPPRLAARGDLASALLPGATA